MAGRDDAVDGWAWFEPPPERGTAAGSEQLLRATAACLGSPEGEVVLAHLRRVFLERRVGPTGTDAELRHVEGQRSVVAHLLALLERARDRQEDRY